MAKVEIYKLNDDGSQSVIATCRLVNNKVVCYGYKSLDDYLSNVGIYDYSTTPPQQIFPSHGSKFLQQLKYNFSSGYFNATEVIDE